MTPAHAIAKLDRQLRRHGQTVTLRRVVANAPAVEIQPRAFVRDYAIEELVGGIIQGDREVVLSPTGQTGVFATAPVRRNDRITIDGRAHNVETANPVRLANVVVRINMQVRG